MKRSMMGIAGVVIFSLFTVAGCSSVSSESGTAEKSLGIVPGWEKYYTQTIQWSRCKEVFECAEVKVPQNWNAQTDVDVVISIIRGNTAAKKKGSLLINPGGPGGSGVSAVAHSRDYLVSQNLIDNFDIIGFDPRGVGSSSAVKCLDDAGMTDYIFKIIPGERGSDQWLDAAQQSAKAFGEACSAQTGDLLGQVDTRSAARDMDVLRAVLGDEKLNYLGYSYGTYLGATYAELFPEKVGRFVLDGAIDPAASNFDVEVAQSQGFESALDAYLQNCVGKTSCLFSSVEDGRTQIGQMLAQLEASPLLGEDGRLLGANTLLTAIIFPLYRQNSWNYLTELFREIQSGKTGVAFALADAYYERSADGTFETNSTEAFIAINCLDYTYENDRAVWRKQSQELIQQAPLFGPYMSYGEVGCTSWPHSSSHERGPIHASGAPPIIVIGTTNDPATPYQWSKNLATQLDQGLLITYEGEGHTAYNKSNSCVDSTVDDFFINGVVPSQPVLC